MYTKPYSHSNTHFGMVTASFPWEDSGEQVWLWCCMISCHYCKETNHWLSQSPGETGVSAALSQGETRIGPSTQSLSLASKQKFPLMSVRWELYSISQLPDHCSPWLPWTEGLGNFGMTNSSVWPSSLLLGLYLSDRPWLLIILPRPPRWWDCGTTGMCWPPWLLLVFLHLYT